MLRLAEVVKMIEECMLKQKESVNGQNTLTEKDAEIKKTKQSLNILLKEQEKRLKEYESNSN